MTFLEWKREVDKILISHVGLAQDDLPDWLARDAYDTGKSPSQAARECMLNACDLLGYDEELVDELL